MAAERRMLASATTASGRTPLGEVRQDLLFRHPFGLALSTDGIAELEEEFASQLDGQVGPVPGNEEARRLPIPRDEDDVPRAKHLRRSVAKIADRDDLQCGHLRVHYTGSNLHAHEKSRELSNLASARGLFACGADERT